MEEEIKANATENSSGMLQKQLLATQKELEVAYDLLKQWYLENEQLKNRLQQYENPGNEYNCEWTWLSKIVFIITKADKPLRSSEIIEQLEYRGEDLTKHRFKEKYISAILNTAMKNGRLIPYKLQGVRGYYYCLPHWIDDKEQLIAGMRRKIY